MCDKPQKIKCDLIVRGTERANASAQKDLDIPDPNSDKALAAIRDGLEVDHEQKRTPQDSDTNNKKDS
jgi:hypothetical protein